MVGAAATVPAHILGSYPMILVSRDVPRLTNKNPLFGWLLVFLISLHPHKKILPIRPAWLSSLYVTLKSRINICASSFWTLFANLLSLELYLVLLIVLARYKKESLLSTFSVSEGFPQALSSHLATTVIDHTVAKLFLHRSPPRIPFESLR